VTPGFIELAGAGQVMRHGDRAARGLMPIDELCGDDHVCCRRCCVSKIEAERATKLWEEFQACENDGDGQNKAELAILLSHMYDSTFGKPTGLCSNFLHELFGASLKRIQRARLLVTSYNDTVPDEATQHGNTGATPANKTRESILAALRNVRRGRGLVRVEGW